MKPIKILLLIAATLTLANIGVTQTWTQTSAPMTNWAAVVASADGTKLIAAVNVPYAPGAAPANPIFISTNSGISWMAGGTDVAGLDSGWLWGYLACSADGSRLLAAPFWGQLCISQDSGNSWQMIGILGGNYSYYWSGVASSADGTKLVATAYGQVDVINSGVMFVSTNSGVDWTQANTTFDVCWSVAIANDGSELIAGAMDDPVYISTDSGTTWLASGSTNELFWSVAASADGSHIVASTFLWGQIFTSANHGETWTVANAPNAAWQAIASSADGSKLVAVIDGGQIYASVDFGKTWTPTDAPSTNWISVASSADGNRFVAAVKGGGIWVSQLNSSPQLNLTTSSNVIVLSWTVPSTNFVLQESTDLISWTDETNPPVLDLTNLQNQITLFPSNASGFFRLKTL